MATKVEKYRGINPETGREWDEKSIQRAERERLSFRVPLSMTKAKLKKLIAAIVEEGVEERAPPAATAKRLIKLVHELGLI